MAPTSMRQWTIEGQNGFDSLKLNEKASVPQLGEKDVLVKCAYAMHHTEYCSTDKHP